ncbi:MAG: DMT family transporter [Ruminococcaceae bacterium]|nr:DMT family transporter [Oscillospiraceae bacterium]
MSKQLKGSLSIILATVIWGSTFVAQSVGGKQVGPFTFLAIRCVLAVAVLLIILLVRKPKAFCPTVFNPRLWLAGIPCGLALFVATALQQLGLIDPNLTAGESGFITTMYIILVPIFGLLLRKKPPLTVLFSVIIALLGLYLLSGGIGNIDKGELLTFGCAIAFAVQILLVDHLAGDLDSMALNMAQALVCAVAAGIVMPFTETFEISNILSCWLPLCYAGVLSMGIAYTLQIVGQKSLEPTTASLLMSFESVFAALSGQIILHEVLSVPEAVGCGLVFGAIILSQIPIKRKKRAPLVRS